MKDNKNNLLGVLQRAAGVLVGILGLVLLLSVGTVYIFFFYEPAPEPLQIAKELKVEPPVEKAAEVPVAQAGTLDEATGFIIDSGWELARANCTSCHAATLVTQNRATREGWEGMIRWMQRTQKLWDLGENEAAILDYLAKNYAPENKGRRPNLAEVEWYELDAAQ